MTDERFDPRIHCNQMADHHAGPIVTDVDAQGYLHDRCRNCGEVWIGAKLTPKRAEQFRRARRAARG